jgi:hypothetical protein
MGIKEDNLAKNKEYDKALRPVLIVSICIAAVAFIVPLAMGQIEAAKVYGIIQLFIVLCLCFGNFKELHAKCPKCAARGYAKRLSKELMSSTHLGNAWRENSQDRSKDYKVAVYNKTYKDRNICIYCDYEWANTYTKKEEEKL